jgi:hypothetical protein
MGLKRFAGVLIAVCLLAPISVMAGSAQRAPSKARSITKVVSDCSHARLRPGRIMVACGDGGFFLRHLHYQRWGPFRARGVGLAYSHDCIPSCAESDFESHRISFVFDRVRVVEGVRLFVHATATYTHDRPDGTPKNIHFALPRPFPYYTFDDDGGGGRGFDIDDSSFSTFTPGHFIVKIEGPDLTAARLNAAELFFDVNRRNTGPEYRLDYLFTADGDGHSGRYIERVDGWSGGGPTVRCPKWRVHVNDTTDVITMDIPRRCLGTPARVRMNVSTWDVTRYFAGGGWEGYVDGVPSYHGFEAGWIS